MEYRGSWVLIVDVTYFFWLIVAGYRIPKKDVIVRSMQQREAKCVHPAEPTWELT